MDTGETYIKMCEKAEEIQRGITWDKGHTWNDGDYYSLEGWGNGVYSFFNYPASIYNAIWLPRQDQLQEMVFGISKDTQGQVWRLYWFATENRTTYPIGIPDSMEQLWLAFVMKEKYNKIWNGEEWVSILKTKVERT